MEQTVEKGLLINSLDFLKDTYKDNREISFLIMEHNTINKMCWTNGKYYPVLAEKGGILYVQTPSSGICQWINLEIVDCPEQEYQESITSNVNRYKEYNIERYKNIRGPVCSYCNKEFQTINGFHKHLGKCKNNI